MENRQKKSGRKNSPANFGRSTTTKAPHHRSRGAARGRLPKAARRVRRVGTSESTLAAKRDQTSANHNPILLSQFGKNYDLNLGGNIKFRSARLTLICVLHLSTQLRQATRSRSCKFYYLRNEQSNILFRQITNYQSSFHYQTQ